MYPFRLSKGRNGVDFQFRDAPFSVIASSRRDGGMEWDMELVYGLRFRVWVGPVTHDGKVVVKVSVKVPLANGFLGGSPKVEGKLVEDVVLIPFQSWDGDWLSFEGNVIL